MSMWDPIRIKKNQSQPELDEETKEIHDKAFEFELLEDSEGARALNGNPDLWYTVRQFAEKAKTSMATVYQWTSRDRVRTDTNSDGVLVIHPLALAQTPRPVAFKGEERIRWEGTFSAGFSKILREHAIGGNSSFTTEMGARLLLVLLGRTEDPELFRELREYLDRHPAIMQQFRQNVHELARALGVA